MQILLYGNCLFDRLYKFFLYSSLNNYIINYVCNYDQNVDLNNFNKLFKTCDIFIYQHNKGNTNIKYNIKDLKDNCIKIKLGWWIFTGFWPENNYIPFSSVIYKNKIYEFLNNNWSDYIKNDYGIHKSFINFNGNYNDIKNKIDNLQINKNYINNYFNESLLKFKKIDDNSDIKMYDFFINNYKNHLLFYCPIHPTNYFINELFNRVVYKIFNITLYINNDLLRKMYIHSLTQYTLPLLPCVTRELNIINYNKNNIILFDDKLKFDIYQYYLMRLSKDNFKISMSILKY